MRSIGKLSIAAVVGTLGLVALPVSGVNAGAQATLGLSRFHQIVADSSHGYLFISQGSTSVNSIVVTNLSGQQVATIGGQDGVMGMALSPNGDTLYAALSSGHAVSAINTATLRETASYPTGNISPYDVAVQGGNLWVSYHTGSSTGGTSAIGSVNIGAAKPAFVPKKVAFGPAWQSAAQLGADPENSGILLAAEPGGEPTSVAVYDVVNGDLAEMDYFSTCGNEQDLAVVPGGQQFLLACGAPYAIDRYHFNIYTGISQQGSYPASTYPDAVAIAPNGTVAASSESTLGGKLYVYRAGSNTPLATDAISGLAAGGLAWSADSTHLYAVSEVSAGSYTVNVIDVSPIAASRLSLGGTPATVLGKSLTITGTLAFSTGTPPAGTKVIVQRTTPSGSGTREFTVSTGSGGRFSLTDKPTAPGTYIYTAFYTGDARHGPSTTGRAVTITKIPTTLTLTASASTVTRGTKIKITAHLGTTYNSRTVSIYAQPAGGTRKLLTRASVNRSGYLTVSYAVQRTTTFTAVFAGDAHYAAKTVTKSVSLRAG